MKGLIGKFATVGGATMASRLLGFAREVLIGAALGAGPAADAFYAAFSLPNLFRRIFAEGAFNAAFVPLFAKKLEDADSAPARLFAEQVVSVLVPILFVLTSVAILFMPFVMFLNNPFWADTPEKFDLTVLMGRIMFPYLFCMSLVAMLSGVLNSLRRYFVAAFVPVLLNVILVTVVAVAMLLEIQQRQIGIWLAWGVFVAGFAQLLLLVAATRRENFRIWPKRPRITPDVKRLLVLMGPAILTGGVLQINLFIGQIIASAQDGARALLNYADRLNQLPLGVIGIAIGVVLLPELSRALKAGDDNEAARLQNRSLEFALGLTLPAAVAFIVIPHLLVALLYERGEFTPETTQLTAQALMAYASGLPAYVLIKVFQPLYFSREDMKTPFRFSVVMVIVNIAGSLLLFPWLGHVAIALSTSVSAWVNLILLVATLYRRGEFQPSPATMRRVVMIVLCSALMGVVVYALQLWLADLASSPLFIERLVATGVIIAVGVVFYFTLIIATGAVDRAQIMRLVRRRA